MTPPAPAAAARRIAAAPLHPRPGMARRRHRGPPRRVRRARPADRGRRPRADGTGVRRIGLSLRFATSRLVPSLRPRRRWAVPDIASDGRSRWAWLSDGRYALRALRHRPALSGAIVATLALALAANATIFTLADALYLRPFRFAGVDRLVVVASAPERDPLADRIVGRPGRLSATGSGEHDARRFRRGGLLGPESVRGRSARAACGLSRQPGVLPRAEGRAAAWPHLHRRGSEPGRDRRVVALTRPVDAAVRRRPERWSAEPSASTASRTKSSASCGPGRPCPTVPKSGRRSPTPRAEWLERSRGLAARARPPGRRSVHRHRTRRDERHRRPPAAAVPRHARHARSFGRELHAGALGRRRRPVPGDLAGRGRVAAANRVRKHRQPADGTRNRAAARVRRPAGAGRPALAAGHAGAHRGRVAGGVLHCAGRAAGRARRRGSRVADCRRACCGGSRATSSCGSTSRCC